MKNQNPKSEHGDLLPYDRNLKQRSRELRNKATDAEKKLWNVFLRNHRLRFTRQKPLCHYIVDFYCSKAKLVIEVDGESHFTNEGKIYDEGRTLTLEQHGLTVMRFTNKEVLENIAVVCKKIEDEIRNRMHETPSIPKTPSVPI
ncbi:MAG: endonuclease domain-containing protein [Bacteroidota bacterium]